ncbi:hypothetical protein MRX96_030293 [Rhipicephalus microplus]
MPSHPNAATSVQETRVNARLKETSRVVCESNNERKRQLSDGCRTARSRGDAPQMPCDGMPPTPKSGGRTPAVRIVDLELWYGSGDKRVDIFKGVNMTVPRGDIYALLGSSGCGKTTLLRCIMGRKHFPEGETSGSSA